MIGLEVLWIVSFFFTSRLLMLMLIDCSVVLKSLIFRMLLFFVLIKRNKNLKFIRVLIIV